MKPFHLFCIFLMLSYFFKVTSAHPTGQKYNSVWLNDKPTRHKNNAKQNKNNVFEHKNKPVPIKNKALQKETDVLEHTNKPLKVYFISDAKPKYRKFMFKLAISAVYQAVKYDFQYICSCKLPICDRKGYCSSLTPNPKKNFKDIPEDIVSDAQEYAYSIIEKIVGAKYSVTSKPLDIDIEEIQTEKRHALDELTKFESSF